MVLENKLQKMRSTDHPFELSNENIQSDNNSLIQQTKTYLIKNSKERVTNNSIKKIRNQNIQGLPESPVRKPLCGLDFQSPFFSKMKSTGEQIPQKRYNKNMKN